MTGLFTSDLFWRSSLANAIVLLILVTIYPTAAAAQIIDDDAPTPNPRRVPLIIAPSPADILVKEFYDWYPCVEPSRAIAITKGNPQLALAILASNRPERDRLAAYTLLVAAKVPGYQNIIKRCVEDRSPLIRSRAMTAANALAEREGKDGK